MHVTDRPDVFLFELVELILQLNHLLAEQFNGIVQMGQVNACGFDVALLVLNLRVEHHQILKSFLHVLLIIAQTTFLLSNLLLQLLTFFLQALNGSIGDRLLFLIIGNRLLLLCRLFFLHSSSCRLLGHLLTLLGIRSQTEA